MDYQLLIGIIASILVTIAYFPEVIHVVRTRSTRDLSLYWLITLILGLGLYSVYGFWINSLPVIISSNVSLILVLIIAAYKLKYK